VQFLFPVNRSRVGDWDEDFIADRECAARRGAGAASAQAMQPLPMLAFRHLELDASALGSLALGSGKTLPQRRYRISSAFHYEMRPLVLYRDGARYVPSSTTDFMLHLLAAHASTSRLGARLKTRSSRARRARSEHRRLLFPSSAAAADPGLGPATPSCGRGGSAGRSRGEFGQELPLGAAAPSRETRGPSATPKLLASRKLGPVLVSVELGTRLRRR